MISSTSNSRVKQVSQWQGKARERKKSGIFVAEGLKMYEEAPEAWVLETYVSERCLEQLKAGARRGGREGDLAEGQAGDQSGFLGQEIKQNSMPAARAVWEKLQRLGYEEVTEEVFARISDTRAPQGILCVLKRPEHTLERMLGPAAPLLIILEDIQDPGNLGTIVRTGEGAGVNGIILTGDTVDIYNPKTIRGTMGSIYRVPHIYIEDTGKIIDRLHSAGIHTYAAHLEGKAYDDSFDFRAGTAFLVGNEGSGLKRETADRAENYLKIPMEGKVESLNAAIAASLLMYEARRQRHR